MFLYDFLQDYYKKICVDNIEIFKNKKILITGSNGLIGSNFVNYFYFLNINFNFNIKIIAHSFSKPIDWLPKDNNIMYLHSDLNKESFDFHFDYLIHAATYGQPKKVLDNKIGTVLLNTTTLIKLLNLAHKNSAKVLFLSSSSIYGETSVIPTPENYNGDLNTFNPSSLYAESKRMAETICKAYIDDYNMDIKIARIAIAYGPGVKLNDKRFLNEFIKKALDYQEIAMIDRGEAKRQFNFITDCIEMCLNILLHAKEYIYNVGGIFDENQNKIVSIANIIGDLLNAKVIVPEYENIQNLHAQSIVNLDIQKYINEFKKNSFVSLKDGIELNIKWIKMLKDNR
ncbi:NAD-dependent epimerase/dehydratase family protein [Campylobacter sp.]|uniref:NAD-dependent epimerase/dehydratase family protein n=1 Tax=Campylobacter sp. TaxID=205 RepID=UPI00259CF455|nr:NAD-dependent epimerase/dehydratase family protein [Campylobacter sp.]MBQ7135315.1 NAD-dependent epimerase/dehydratase family protein [Campylobacter sp.]